MGFGSYFRDLRIEKQITQKQIADVIKKKPMLVSNVENGKNGPFSDNDLKKIVSFLELSKDEERQLYKEAAKARGKLPQEMQAYIIKNDEAYYLLEILARNELGSESLEIISVLQLQHFWQVSVRQKMRNVQPLHTVFSTFPDVCYLSGL